MKRIFRCSLLLGLLAAPALAAPAAAPLVPAGLARVDVTPKTPVRLSGYASRQKESEGVAQPLFARALAIGDGPEAAVIVTVGVIGVPARIVEDVAARLLTKAKLPRERFTVCATHTHCGPTISRIAANIFSQELKPEEKRHLDDYARELSDGIEKAALEALAARKPARLGWGQGEAGLAMNRRVVVNGKWVKIGDNKDGPVDHALPVLRVTAPDGKLRGVFINYACHCTTLGGAFNKVHGDWAGSASEELEAKHPGAVALISIGCAGDANPYPRGDEETARLNGRGIAEAVEKVLAGPFKPLLAPPVCKLERFEIPLAPLPTKEQWQERAKGKGRPAQYAQQILERLARGEKLPTSIPYVAQGWAFGDDLAMVFLAGEVVVDYSLRLKKELDGKRLWVTAYANDVPCYIASKRILPEGGYEVEGSMVYYDIPGPLAAEAEDRIIEVAKSLVPKTFVGPIKKQ